MGDYFFEIDRPEYQHLRRVEWTSCQKPIVLRNPITTKTLTRFTSDKTWLQYLFELIDADPEEREARPKDTDPEPYDLTTALSGLFMEEADFQHVVDSISLRKNLILQGTSRGREDIHRTAHCMVPTGA